MGDKGESNEHKYRYERKFVISETTPQEVELFVKLHPAIFSEIYHQRQVNNIYFDTIEAENFFDNVYGTAHRKKVRIRWYGNLFGIANMPVLEIKGKQGLVGKKETFQLVGNLVVRVGLDVEHIVNLIMRSEIPNIVKQEMRSLTPTLLNHYKRRYFASADKKFRITVDADLRYYEISNHINSFENSVDKYSKVILELKYSQKWDDTVNQITDSFPFRMTKSSKYVDGIEAIYIL